MRGGKGSPCAQRLAADLGQVWHISQSQTYNILNRLETQGDISSTTLEQEKLPPRQVLQITQKGRERFDKWMDMPTGSSVRAIRLEFNGSGLCSLRDCRRAA